MGSEAQVKAYAAEPYSWAEARALSEQLGLSEPVAVTLVRRGYRTAGDVRRFLAADEEHDPFQFDSMPAIVERILAAIGTRRWITVHGDYDVDGVCATSILIGTLRALGARCDWFIPDRVGEGYGLTQASVRQLSSRGSELVITVDCGITSAAEVELARAAGIELIVTDHHAPAARLPDCPILHPVVSGYPFTELCGTAVAHKLAAALRAAAGRDAEPGCDLDLVALATVCDMVPLRGENRTLVRRGLAEARRARRVGLRALMEVSATDPSRLSASDFGFRLGPRINAAGRLYRADAGVELMLSDDEERAAEIAAELQRANSERRGAEQQVIAAAERARGELPSDLADAPALVLAGQDWHPGVVGIAASRLVEAHWRPVVLIGLNGDGHGRGSGRGIPGIDLVEGLEVCAEHLLRFGGHSAAAGLEIEAGRVDAFREAFMAYAAATLSPRDLVRTDGVDAFVGGDSLGYDLAEELEHLGPFGNGNPEVRLLVPAAKLGDVRPMGEEGRHARFSLEAGGGRAAGVAFGADPGLLDNGAEPGDTAVVLELNRWHGTVEPRVVLRERYERAAARPRPASCAECPRRATGEEWWHRVEVERTAELADWPPAALLGAAQSGPRRVRVERTGRSMLAALAELASSGESVMALCADASRRRERLADAIGPFRVGAARVAVACGRCADGATLGEGPAELALVDWSALARDPGLPLRFQHAFAIDPAPFEHLEGLAGRGCEPPSPPGWLHVAWGPEELELARRVLDAEWELRPALAAIYRELRAAGPRVEGERLAEVLAGPGRHPRGPETAGRCLRVLRDLGLVELGDGPAAGLGVVSSDRTQLERSTAYVAYRERHEEGIRFLATREHKP